MKGIGRVFVRFAGAIRQWFLDVPIRAKIAGVVILPVIILGIALRYWVRQGLSDWLNWLLDPERVGVAMQAGGRSVVYVTIVAVLVAAALASLLVMALTQPLFRLREVAERITQGDLDVRVPVSTNDEIGQVARDFNRMLDQLVRSQRQLERSNRRLSALYHVTSSIGHGLQLDRVLDAALDSTLAVTGLRSGWIYLREVEADRFFLTTATSPPSPIVSSDAATAAAPCSCQDRLMDPDQVQDPSIHVCGRLESLKTSLGIAPRHLSVPLATRGQTLGVMNLLWVKEREPYAEELELLDAIGVQISEAVANARLHDDLRREEAGRRALMASLATAQEDERARLSAELHDGTGQELTSLLLRLKSLEYEQDGDKLQGRVDELCTDLSGSIERLRELSHQLRPPDLERLGLGPAIRNLADDMFGGEHIACEVNCGLDGETIPEDVQISLFRITQEAFTNIVRHSKAARVAISCQLAEGWVQLNIEDDGTGFNPDDLLTDGKSHFGLASIQERAERLGGSLQVHTAPGAGTSLQVEIPARQEVLA